jgi:tetratricopeptide (TPR) repeat protein
MRIPGFRKTLPVPAVEAERAWREFEVALARAVLRVRARRLDALAMLGHALTALGRHEEALEADLRAVEVAPEDATARYNLACSFANLGRVDEAISALREAVRLGYRDVRHMEADPDLASIRSDPRYRALVEALRRRARRRRPV